MAAHPFRRLGPYFRRYRWRYVLGGACIIAAVVLRLEVPRLLGASIDALRQADDADEPLGGLVWRGSLLILAAAAAGALVRTGSRIVVLGTARRVVRDLRQRLFGRLLKLPPSWYGRMATGDLMSRAVNDVQNVQGLFGPVFMYLSETAMLYVVGISFLAATSVPLTVVALLPFPFVLWRARRIAAHIQQGSRAAQEQLSALSTKVEESLSGHMVVKSLGLEDFDTARFAEQATRLRDNNLTVTYMRGRLTAWTTGLSASCTLSVFLVGGWQVVEGAMSLGDFVAAFFYLQMLAGPTGVLGFVLSSMKRGAAALIRVGEILDADDSLQDAPELSPRTMVGDLQVRDLTVVLKNEHGEPRTVLDRVSLEVPSGKVLGVLGRTGSGKSVLLRALARQLEVDPGTVYYDGVAVEAWRIDDLRRDLGVVPQEAFLFSDTLEANVALARPGATREEVLDALRLADLEKDLVQFPNGLDTLVGERGLNVSGGQRQRVALARVLLGGQKVMLFDDPFSAMDAHTTERILEGLRPMMAGRTVVLVAHRVATVRQADQILMMDQGRVVERGSHEELIALGGHYAALHARQQERDEREEGAA